MTRAFGGWLLTAEWLVKAFEGIAFALQKKQFRARTMQPGDR
jgi:hypothetical protein